MLSLSQRRGWLLAQMISWVLWIADLEKEEWMMRPKARFCKASCVVIEASKLEHKSLVITVIAAGTMDKWCGA